MSESGTIQALSAAKSYYINEAHKAREQRNELMKIAEFWKGKLCDFVNQKSYGDDGWARTVLNEWENELAEELKK